jgi:outer membrane lipoprotein-sorting protein
LTKKIFFLLKIFFLFFLSINIVLADLQKNLINKLTATQTLTFDFKQKIADKEEIGNCFVKYPLLMKCNYKNSKGKTIISNGKTVAIIKKKYKKIYLYPIKSTPLSFILEKEKIIDLIRKSNPPELNSDLIGFIFADKKKNKVKMLFDKNSLELKGWETNDAYSNKVNFEINNLIINNQIVDDFFKIPQEKDL